MPRAETSILNRSVHAIAFPGETNGEVNAAYRRRVDNPEGLSLTGFVATFQIGAPGASNSGLIFLLEDASINLSIEIAAQGYERFSLFEYRQTFRNDQSEMFIREQFNVPYQLRYGHEYLLVAYTVLGGVVAPPHNTHLTAFGYENSQESPTRIALR